MHLSAKANADQASVTTVVVPLPPCGCPKTAASAEASATKAILYEKYRALARHHLQMLPALFTRFTGLFCHLAWAPTWPQKWSAHDLPTHSRLCRGVTAGCRDTLARCRHCAARHLALALKSEHNGHQFTCFLGVQNFWLPMLVRGCLVGLAFIQAVAIPVTRISPRHSPSQACQGAAVPLTAAAARCPSWSAKRMSRKQFGNTAKLLQLVIRYVETSVLGDLDQSELLRTKAALRELQTEATRLRTELHGLVRTFNKTAPALESENHTDRLIHAALDYIHRHYSEPFTLQQYADLARVNAAYLSSRFSRAVGTPFKTYLTEVRVEKARELLSDPSRSVSEVAYAVGYASENRFRLAFKQVTGVSPRRWRETLRMEMGASA